MSHFNDFETTITDPDALVRALARMGIQEKDIEKHSTAVRLNGYHAEEKNNAHVVVRRKVFGTANSDIGWELKDGKYVAHIDEFDYGNGSPFNKIWQTKLYTYYNVEKSKIEFEQRGIEYTESKDDKGRIQLRAKFKAQNVGPRIQVRR
jgi:hypothetical protein